MTEPGETRQERFDRILRETEPVPDQLRAFLLRNLTTDPHYHPKPLALNWMQCQPWKWEGHNAARCTDVAEMMIEHQEPPE